METWLQLLTFVSTWPAPLLSLVDSFKLFSLYLSQATFTRLACWRYRCLTINGIKMLSVYFPDVETVVTGRAWTIAAAGTHSKMLWNIPSTMVKVTEFSTSKIAWWVKHILKRSFFLYMYIYIFLFSIAKKSTKSFALTLNLAFMLKQIRVN